jgi:hypothetical protein
MKYVLSRTDALTFYHNLRFIPLHYTYEPFTSSPQFISLPFPSIPFTSLHFTSLHFTSLHFTSLHFTSLHFTAFLMIPYTTSLHLIYHFPNPFPK